LEPFQPDFSGVDRNWNKREWTKIDQIRKYVNDKKNKKYFRGKSDKQDVKYIGGNS
jgi:DNA-directed RNA polymerase delta subunit